jgi:hypothetical protein
VIAYGRVIAYFDEVDEPEAKMQYERKFVQEEFSSGEYTGAGACGLPPQTGTTF